MLDKSARTPSDENILRYSKFISPAYCTCDDVAIIYLIHSLKTGTPSQID